MTIDIYLLSPGKNRPYLFTFLLPMIMKRMKIMKIYGYDILSSLLGTEQTSQHLPNSKSCSSVKFWYASGEFQDSLV